MLTDDGKHLYVSWDEYHMLIERLALKVHNSGWQFDQILCLARGGMRPGRRAVAGLRQAAGDHVDQFLPRRGRHHPGPAGHRQVHHPAQGRTGRPRAAGRRPGRLRRHAAGGGRAAARHALDQRAALGGDLGQGASRPTRPTTSSNTCPPARGSTSPSRNTTTCAPTGWRRSSSSDARKKKGAGNADPALHINIWCPGRDSNPHGVTR